jgi:hypothetical protein
MGGGVFARDREFSLKGFLAYVTPRHRGDQTLANLRISPLILSYLGIFAVGGAIGFGVGFDTARTSQRLGSEAGAADWFNAHLFAERMMGDSVAYRNTLLDYLAALHARREKGGGIVLNEHATTVDIVLTESRLAILAESQGHSEQSAQLFAQAVADCPKAWNDGCTMERLRELVQRLDRKLPSPARPLD